MDNSHPKAPLKFDTIYSSHGYHIIELQSLKDVSRFVDTLQRRSQQEYVYRGQANAKDPLETSLTRILKSKDEAERKRLRREHLRTALFELRGRVSFHGELAECLDALTQRVAPSISTAYDHPRPTRAETQIEVEFWAYCQHYGLKTPLLDWSFSPGVAFFFAIEQEPTDPRHMAAVFAINKTLTSVAIDHHGESLDFVTPIRLANPRIAAQRGLFTLSGRDVPIEDWLTDAFAQASTDVPALFKLTFPVTEGDRAECLRWLRDRNITHSSVYPDIQGATDHTNRLLLEKLSPLPIEKSASVAGDDPTDADIGLAGKTLLLRVTRTDGRPSRIVEARLAGSTGPAIGPTSNEESEYERWIVRPLDDDTTAGTPSRVEWKYRAGCAYLLERQTAPDDGQPEEVLFLKTPDLRHFAQRNLAEIRASFTEEERHLSALQEQESSPPNTKRPTAELRVAKVIASVELKFDDVPQSWPQEKTFPVLIHQYIREKQPLERKLGDGRRWLDVEQWLALAHALTDTLRRVHNRSILHAALAARHVLVTDVSVEGLSKAHIVGFGASALLGEAGSRAATFARPKSPWLAPEVHETEDLLGPLSFSTDIYSLGLVLLWAATGVAPETLDMDKLRHTVLLKREIAARLKEQNASLAERHDIAKIIDTCLRHEPTERYSCMEELLDAIEAAKETRTGVTREQVKKAIDDVSSVSSETWDDLHPFFRMLLKRNIDRLKDDFIQKTADGHYEVYGNRNVLIDYLCNFMNLVEDGGTYRTVTLPGYWTDRNLGSDGRFLAKNKDLLKRHVNVERIFLVSGPFHKLPYAEQEVLLAHYRALRELAGPPRERFRISVAIKPSDSLLRFEKGGQAVAIISPRRVDGSGPNSVRAVGVEWREFIRPAEAHAPPISLRFVSTGKRFQHGGEYFIDREIRKLRFKEIDDAHYAEESEQMGYAGYLRESVPLDQFIQQKSEPVVLGMITRRQRSGLTATGVGPIPAG